MQPATGLALARLMKSSELESGVRGRNRALWLRDAALSNMEQSTEVDDVFDLSPVNCNTVPVPINPIALPQPVRAPSEPTVTPSNGDEARCALTPALILHMWYRTGASTTTTLSSTSPHHPYRSPTAAVSHGARKIEPRWLSVAFLAPTRIFNQQLPSL